MAVPIAYNLRNLVVRKTTTIMTALGIALTVAVLLSILALVNGLRQAFRATGNPLQVLVLRKGSEAELTSGITRLAFQDMKFKQGIAKATNGDPMISPELIVLINVPSVDNPEGSNITVRGISPIGIEMRPGIKLAAGRWFDAGKREVVVGKSIAERFPAARIGQKLAIGRGDWEVVGVDPERMKVIQARSESTGIGFSVQSPGGLNAQTYFLTSLNVIWTCPPPGMSKVPQAGVEVPAVGLTVVTRVAPPARFTAVVEA
jgi:ABC-type antimicrobial peptide transport system permease subunit